MPDTVGSDQHKPTSLRGIANRAKACKHHRFRDLYRNLNAEFLLSCWGNLNKAAAGGADEVTAQAYQENLEVNIQALVERLKTKRYRAKLVRRCYIPKENGYIMRPISCCVTCTAVVWMASLNSRDHASAVPTFVVANG